MQEVINILEHAEVVLMKKIKSLQDGKPKYAASEKLTEIRYAISLLKMHDDMQLLQEAEQDADLLELLVHNPPHAKA